MDLANIETQLKKRRAYPSRWHHVQNDSLDHLTKFVYRVDDFESVLEEIDKRFGSSDDYQVTFDYALNRW